MEARNEFVRDYFGMLDEKTRSDICWSYYQRLKGMALLNSEELRSQSKLWRYSAKEGKLKIHAYNNVTKTTFDGREWHLLVITPYKDGEEAMLKADPAAAMLMKQFINGYVYFFKKKENRDSIYEYVMKGLEKGDKHECCLCGESYGEFGNSASPLSEGSCCDNCNASLVIPARIQQHM